MAPLSLLLLAAALLKCAGAAARNEDDWEVVDGDGDDRRVTGAAARPAEAPVAEALQEDAPHEQAPQDEARPAEAPKGKARRPSSIYAQMRQPFEVYDAEELPEDPLEQFILETGAAFADFVDSLAHRVDAAWSLSRKRMFATASSTLTSTHLPFSATIADDEN